MVLGLVARLVSLLVYLAMLVLWGMCIIRPNSMCSAPYQYGALGAVVVAGLLLILLLPRTGLSVRTIVAFVLLIPQLILWFQCVSGDCSASTKWGGLGLAILGFLAALLIPV